MILFLILRRFPNYSLSTFLIEQYILLILSKFPVTLSKNLALDCFISLTFKSFSCFYFSPEAKIFPDRIPYLNLRLSFLYNNSAKLPKPSNVPTVLFYFGSKHFAFSEYAVTLFFESLLNSKLNPKNFIENLFTFPSFSCITIPHNCLII